MSPIVRGRFIQSRVECYGCGHDPHAARRCRAQSIYPRPHPCECDRDFETIETRLDASAFHDYLREGRSQPR